MKISSIKKAFNNLLSSKYEGEIEIDGKEIKEGYKKPCFFTEIIVKPSAYETRYWYKGGVTLKATYYQKEKNELDQLTKFDEIKELFGMTLAVEDRKLLVKEIDYDFVGEKSDILQISIDIDFTEQIVIEETEPFAEDVNVNLKEE